MKHADQVVLIGDHKQLGPIYKQEVQKCDSMFSRLIEGGFQFTMLTTQYRMHPYLLTVPNVLFYDNKIVSGYKKSFDNKFINSELPFLFIDCETIEEGYGTSFSNG